MLRTQDLGEADRIVTLYSRNHGKIRAVAKGVRKTSSRFGARVEPFQRVDAQFHRGKTLDTISQAVTITPYAAKIAADFDKYSVAAAMAEVIDRLTNEGFDPTAQHYLMFVGGLHALSEGQQPPPLILDAFVLRSIAMAGWAPELRNCAECGAAGPHYAFDIARGGVVCRDCRRPGAVAAPPAVTEHMIFLLARHWDEARATEPSAQAAAGALIAKILAHHVERPLATLELIDRTVH